MIKESVREVLAEERISVIQALIPPVSRKERADIERRYGKISMIFKDRVNKELIVYEIDFRGNIYK